MYQDDRVLDEGALIELGRHCSETEVEATAAERELRDFLVMQFLRDHHLGDEFTGVITGLMGSAVFVSIERFLVEGMIRTTDMPQSGGHDDRWVANNRTGRIVAQRSGASLGVGDIVTVQIVRVDLASRHLDLRITKLPTHDTSKTAGSRSRPEGSGKRTEGKRKGYKQGRRGRKGR